MSDLPLAQISDELALDVEGDQVFHSSSKERLPFAFSHRFQLVLAKDNAQLSLFYTQDTPLSALLEVRRYTGVELPLHKLEKPQFEAKLTQAFQANSSEA